MTRVTITTDTGPLDIHGTVIGDDILAVHETIRRKLSVAPLAPFTLSHLPTGYALIRGYTETVLVKVGKALVTLVPDVLALNDRKQITAQMPGLVVDWLWHCHRDGWMEPPSLNGAVAPREKIMPKQKTFKAGPAAQKIVRQLVQSMTTENRKAFHEGLRVATKDHIANALLEAFDAGKGGCLFSQD